MSTVTELADAYEAKAKSLHEYMEAHKTGEGYVLDADERQNVRTMKADMESAFDAWTAAKEDGETARKAADAFKSANGIERVSGVREPAPVDMVPTFNLKAALDEARPNIDAWDKKSPRVELFDINDPDQAETWIKAVIALTDITPVETRRPEILPSAQYRMTVSDMMASGTTDGNTLTYMEETTFTNAAVEVAEGVAKPESTLDFTERTDNVRKIATYVNASDEVLADNRQLRSYIDGRLRFMIQQREEQQLLVGDGTAPNISGILDRSGIQTQAKGADPTPDAIFKALTKVRVTGDAEPDGVVLHPNDWQDVRLLRTADGIYIWGSPADAGPERIWGYPVRVTTAITENTGLVGAFRSMAQVFRREGLTVVASTEHASNFTSNLVTILAETRLALAVYRPAAFCSVTGI
jgi:HK97 family phage major capsid protein